MSILDLLGPLLFVILIIMVIGIAAFVVKLSDAIDKQEKVIKNLFRIIEENHAEARNANDAFESTREKVVSVSTRVESVEFELKGMRDKMKEAVTKKIA
jgi:DNA repair exonuclease SbcCD ATPase subunit